MSPRRPARAARALATLAAASVLLGGATATAAPGDDRALPPGGVSIGGQDLPVHGTFAYRGFQIDTNPEIRGAVHGVRRIDGGTVLYYSLGMAGGQGAEKISPTWAFPNSSHPYQMNRAVDVALIDPVGLTAYRPLADATTTFASDVTKLAGEAGALRVGWAVFPELPPGVETVQVVMAWGTAVGDVPVEDGALTPVSSDPAPRLGDGWPQTPSGAELAGADPSAWLYTLTRRTSDVAGTAAMEETAEQVAVTLDANVLFASGSADLSAEAQQVLATVAADIQARGAGEVVVTGHTDSDGSDSFNQTLSEQRAGAVLGVLQPASGSAVTFTAVGRGEAEPVASNATDEGKQANRRVTVVYSVQGDS